MEKDKQGSPKLKDQVYSREEYAKASFWDDRYAEKGGFFDWYAEYPELTLAFAQYGIATTDRVLMVGCGNSKLSQQMFEAGYKDIINIDISPSVIEQMNKQYPHMVWEVMDATEMTYPDGHFDCVIDKGTLDALISGKNFDICEAMLQECMRVTKEEGQLIQITYGSPEGRRKIFENALPFKDYDYYQCRAELNDMSTLINLMRSNIPGQSLRNIIVEKQALAKTMKQFALIKLMRKSRRNVKQYILWSNHQQSHIEINPSHPHQASKQPEKVQKPASQKIEQKDEPKKEVAEEKTVQKQKEASFNYNPKKQPYVFVYSIRRKFTLGIHERLQSVTAEQLQKQFWNTESQRYEIQGHPESTKLTVRLNEELFEQALKALKFLKLKGTSSSEVLLTKRDDQQLDKSLKINVVGTDSANKWVAIRKSNVVISVKLTQKITLEYVLKQLKGINGYLTNRCSLHPCPKTYALLHVLKNRKMGKSVNELLQKYWFPTYKVASANSQEITINLSFPPVTVNKQQQILKAVVERLAPAVVRVQNVRRGYLSHFDLELLNIASMACLSCAGARLEVILEDFWKEDELQDWLKGYVFNEKALYNLLSSTLAVPSTRIQQVLAHLLAFY